MQDNGMSEMDLSLILAMWCLGAFASQIPAAWGQNRFGQKNCIVFGQVLKAAAFALWFLWPTFAGFSVGMILWGVQCALFNVAGESMLYDELAARRHAAMYSKILGRRKAISTVGGALSSAGSLLLFFGYGVITYASLFTLLISSIFIMRIRFKYGAGARAKKTDFMRLLKTGTKIVRKTPCIFYMIILTTLFWNFSYIENFFSLIGLDVGIRREFVGGVAFFIACCKIVGQAFAHRFKQIKDRALYAGMAIAGVIFILFSAWYSIAAILLLGAGYVLISAINVVAYARFQDFIPPMHRPVALSLFSLSDYFTYVIAILIFGFGSDIGGLSYSIFLMGAACILIGIWALIFVRDKCSIEHSY
jgi:MFS family permease